MSTPQAQNSTIAQEERMLSLKVVQSCPDSAYKVIAKAVAHILNVQTCVITFADGDGQWAIASAGTGCVNVGSDVPFIEAALTRDEIFVVPDAAQSDQFMHNADVQSEGGIRFFAAVPLRIDDDFKIGVLSIFDIRPRVLGTVETKTLLDFASLIVDELHLRLKTHRLEAEVRDRRESERSSLAAQRERADFLAMVAHEVRAPLNAIVGIVELMSDPAHTRSTDIGLSALRDSSDYLVRLLNEVLDVAKLEATGFPFMHQAFDVGREVRRTAAIVSPQAHAKRLDLMVEIDSNVPTTVVGDATRVSQIIFNLLSNAIKFTQRGTIRLAVTSLTSARDEVVLEIRVEDSGIGMSRPTMEAVFEEFSQGSADVQARFGGTGLGLAICKKLAQGMNGSIRVESEDGLGSTFICVLPFEASTVSLEDGAREACVEQHGHYRILVADDDPVSRKVCAALLARSGHLVNCVSNGVDAMAALRSGDFDVALLDLDMPGASGYSVARELRLVPGCSIPLVALTGFSPETKPGSQGSVASCFDAYLVKPVTAAALERTIGAVLDPSPSIRLDSEATK